MAEETEAQRNQVIYQSHVILEVGFNPQSDKKPPPHLPGPGVGPSRNACWRRGCGGGDAYGMGSHPDSKRNTYWNEVMRGRGPGR